MVDNSDSRKNIDALYNENPLLAFSLYTHVQIETLNKLAGEILAALDASIQGDQVDASGFKDVYGKFWLWVIGSYEVVRTMARAYGCFSARAKEDLARLHDRLNVIRIPFAKQEIAKSQAKVYGKPIATEASVSGIDKKKRDVSYRLGTDDIWVRDLIERFRDVISGVSRADVLKDLRDKDDRAG